MMLMLSAISIINPLMFAGLLCVSFPIIAHLLNRKATRRLVFPSIMLLSETWANQSQLFKLRRLLLLLLRCFAILLLVWAFTRPVWVDRASGVTNPQSEAALILLLDVSASSAQRHGGVSAIHSIRASAGRVLDSMTQGHDRVNLVYASAHPHTAFPDLTSNIPAVRQELDNLKPTYERADMFGAIALAGKALSKADGQKHLVILTDLQATNWADIDKRLAVDRVLPKGTQVSFVIIDGAASDNVALLSPKIMPAMPIVGQQSQAVVQLTNFSNASKLVNVHLQINGQVAGTQSVRLEPWQNSETSFAFTPGKAGEHRLNFSISDDNFELDNNISIIARVVQRIPVVVIGDDPPDQPGTGTYFTIRALAPRDTMQDRYEVSHLNGDDINAASLADAAAVFVSQLDVFSNKSAKALADYLSGGGGVIFFCGEGAVGQNLQSLVLAMGKETPLTLPWTPVARHDLGIMGDLLYITEGQWQSTLLREFDPVGRLALSRIRFLKTWSIEPTKSKADVLLRFSDQSPAIGVVDAGAGRLILANFSPALAWSDLGKYGSFVVLIHSLVREAQPSVGQQRLAVVGQTYHFITQKRDDPKGPVVQLLDPMKQPVTRSRFYREHNKLNVWINQPKRPGIYTVVQGDNTLGSIAVNLDERESDLRRIDSELLKSLLAQDGSGVRLRNVAEADNMADLHGQPLWGWFLLTAIMVFGVELMLLGYWRR